MEHQCQLALATGVEVSDGGFWPIGAGACPDEVRVSCHPWVEWDRCDAVAGALGGGGTLQAWHSVLGFRLGNVSMGITGREDGSLPALDPGGRS